MKKKFKIEKKFCGNTEHPFLTFEGTPQDIQSCLLNDTFIYMVMLDSDNNLKQLEMAILEYFNNR